MKIKNNRYLSSIIDTFEKFKLANAGKPLLGGPGFIHTGLDSIHSFFDSHQTDLSVFNTKLITILQTYYAHTLYCLEISSQHLEKKLGKYYAGDKTIGYEDIVRNFEETIQNKKAVIKISDEILAHLSISNQKLLGVSPDKKECVNLVIKKIKKLLFEKKLVVI